jgi:deferrochelatase/peroxidase EfeB
MSVSRRRFLGLLGAGAATAAVGASAAAVASTKEQETAGDAVPFFGEHQAGIVTAAQDRLHFAAFDLTTDRREDLIRLLQEWTVASAAMTAGQSVGEFGATSGPYDAPPQDTGEALGLPPSALTITVGFGRSLFDDRFGLAAQLPPALIELPKFPADTLDPARTGGDLFVQACANDPQVAVHAVRNLARIGFGTTTVRWSQLGFGRTSATTSSQSTPRNLFGFKDGTANVKAEDPDVAQSVWVQNADGPEWMSGGTYGVARRIRMTIETWDRTSLREQEAIIGRTKSEGAPLSGGDEFTAPDFEAKGAQDLPLIPMDSHVRLAHPDRHGGVRMLRRGYNYTDGSDGLGRLDAGLFFLAYQRDVRTAFLPVQQLLARSDTLNEYIRHTGSAVFAVPPGVRQGDYLGRTLLEG